MTTTANDIHILLDTLTIVVEELRTKVNLIINDPEQNDELHHIATDLVEFANNLTAKPDQCQTQMGTSLSP